MSVPDGYFSRSNQEKRGHAIQWNPDWEYCRTWVFDRDHPDGWAGQDTPPEGGWERNTEVGDPDTPGSMVIDGASGQMLVSYWRRPKAQGRRAAIYCDPMKLSRRVGD